MLEQDWKKRVKVIESGADFRSGKEWVMRAVFLECDWMDLSIVFNNSTLVL